MPTIPGDDTPNILIGGPADDTVRGLGASDTLFGGGGRDLLDGGSGFDIVDFEGTPDDPDLNVDLALGREDAATGSTLVSIEGVKGGGGDDVISGDSGANWLNGSDGDDALNGRGGDDAMVGGLGDDVVDGGAGYDTVAMGDVGFRGAGPGGSGGRVTITTSLGTDNLTNVEVVTFADGRLVMDEDAAAAQVTRLYEAALDRLPDQGGLNFWIDAAGDGLPLSVLADGFIESPEFQSRFGGAASSNGAFVDQLYLNVLGRAGEAEGRKFWVDSLNGGTARADVLVAFSESPENKAGTAELLQNGIWDRSEEATEVARLYDTVFGRLPDASGLVAWKDSLENGSVTLDQMADFFTASGEFRGQYGTLDNRQFATALYNNTLDRAPEQAGLDHWTRVLDSGAASRAEVVLAFSESVEHAALTAANIQSENTAEFGILFV